MNFKALIEKRNDIVDQMSQLFGAAEAEKRALSTEEVEKFEGLKAEIAKIDATLKAAEEARGFEPMKETKKESSEEAEVRAFEKFLRGAKVEELRSGETQLVDGSSGVVLPKTIAKRILEAVKNISPILAKSDLYMVKGTLVFPKYDETSDSITVAYASEFTDLAEHSGVFTTVSLAQNLAGALVKISRSLINNEDFDVVSYAIAKVAEAIAKFFEGELIAGTGATGHMTGALVGGTSVTAAAATAISADDLINVQMAVAQKYRDNANACWIMATSTLKAIRKLKDKEDRYLLTPDYAAGFGYTLLGHRVFESDAMDAIAASKKTVLFGGFKGLGVRITPEVQMQVLNEKFATQHATGITAWVEADSKVLDAKAIGYLTMAASDPS